MLFRSVRTNTPLQSLTTLNDPAFFTAARALAARVLREAGPTTAERADYAFRLCIARSPGADERTRLLAFRAQQLERLERDPEAARAIVGPPEPGAGSPAGDASGPADLAERAAWTALARVLMNLDEFVTKR